MDTSHLKRKRDTIMKHLREYVQECSTHLDKRAKIINTETIILKRIKREGTDLKQRIKDLEQALKKNTAKMNNQKAKIDDFKDKTSITVKFDTLINSLNSVIEKFK